MFFYFDLFNISEFLRLFLVAVFVPFLFPLHFEVPSEEARMSVLFHADLFGSKKLVFFILLDNER